jgi:hypothetical protein
VFRLKAGFRSLVVFPLESCSPVGNLPEGVLVAELELELEVEVEVE